MGGTGWSYFTPFNESPDVALQALRNNVFASGEYGMTHQFTDEALAGAPAELKKIMGQLREMESGRIGDRSRYKSIKDLREACGENGTHSILDIERTSEQSEPFTAWPADASSIQEVYGTDRPSRSEIEAKPDELSELLEVPRWEAVYLTVFKDGKPFEIYFEGSSGD